MTDTPERAETIRQTWERQRQFMQRLNTKPVDEPGFKALTVGELRTAMEGAPDDLPVVLVIPIDDDHDHRGLSNVSLTLDPEQWTYGMWLA